jgi:secreted trypsin-like serine protease
MTMTIQSSPRNNNKNSTMTCCWLGLLLVAVGMKGSLAEDHTSLRRRNLIIGGGTAAPDRFPYYVALKDHQKEIQCGGTLIAPDIVLTAAHCRNSNLFYADVGKYTTIDGQDQSEEIEILDLVLNKTMSGMGVTGLGGTIGMLEATGAAILDRTGFIHPDHDLQSRTYDVMLIKLSRPAWGKPLANVNAESTIPAKQPGGRNEITIVGMGVTDATGQDGRPDVLKEVHVDYLTYEECVDVTYSNLDYKFQILPHMICAHGAGTYSARGQCYGDSGGPYILRGKTFEEDVQVAVVSWAVNCASDIFPMIGSRTSESIDFIKKITCAMSAAPPAKLCSAENNAAEGLQSRINVQDGVNVSVRIFADPFGHELKWQIMDRFDPSKVYVDVPYGKIKGDHMFQDVVLPAGGNLKFKIDDAADDGIFGDSSAILYEIVMTNDRGELVIVEGNGQFGSTREELFSVPKMSDLEYSALFRSTTEAKATDRYAITIGPTAPFEIYIKFADYHEDTAWSVTSLDGTTTYGSKPENSYRYGTEAKERIKLPAGEFQFTISDRRGTDDYRAFDYYSISYINENPLTPQTTRIYDSRYDPARLDGALSGEKFSHVFSIPADVVVDPMASSTGQGVLIDNADFMGAANQEQLCLETNKYCTSSSRCCSNECRGFRCQPEAAITMGTATVEAATPSASSIYGTRDRIRGERQGGGGAAHRGSP